MILFKVDLLDGSAMEVVVRNSLDAERLNRFIKDADNAFNDRDRWLKMRDLMTHESAGPNYGWTLGFVMPGDEPDQAIDNWAVGKEAA